MNCLIAWELTPMQLVQCIALLPDGSGQWNSCNAVPHCLGAVGSANLAMHCHSAWGQWVVELEH